MSNDQPSFQLSRTVSNTSLHNKPLSQSAVPKEAQESLKFQNNNTCNSSEKFSILNQRPFDRRNQLESSQGDHEDGVIHGHIHNFSQFTYIHGHIHTNEPQTAEGYSNTAVNKSSQPSNNRHSHHCHPNDTHASQFTDCQHFEFMNCHDNLDQGNLIIEDLALKCQEDEHCKPKIMEICCETQHPMLPSQATTFPNGSITNTTLVPPEVPFQTNLPNCVTNALLPSSIGTFINANVSNFPQKICEQNGNGAGADIDCGLDTCEYDDLCRFCDDLGIPYPTVSIKNDPETMDGPTSIYPTQQQQQQQSFGVKRNRDGPFDDLDLQQGSINNHAHIHSHNTAHMHHLHHHNHGHSHSTNHHHHHIQLHDHNNTKKQCTSTSAAHCGGNSDLINFSWNFKNQPKKCEWADCRTVLENPIQLQHHIMENHLIVLPQTTKSMQDSLEDEGYSCEWKDCEYLGDDLFQLLNHINCTHNTQKDFQISDLPIMNSMTNPTVNDKSLFEQTSNQKVNDQLPEVKEETVCRWHVPGEEPCNIQFQSGEELSRHILEDHVGAGKSQYICYWQGCPREHKVFAQRQKIVRHMHVHTRYKPFGCTICGHRFITENILEQHIRTHSGEKPFICKICGKAFARSSSLSIHNRVHTGEKPLVCKYPGCGKRFSESSNLTKHMKTHDKSWICPKCGKGFAKEKRLETHFSKCSAVNNTVKMDGLAVDHNYSTDESISSSTNSSSNLLSVDSSSNDDNQSFGNDIGTHIPVGYQTSSRQEEIQHQFQLVSLNNQNLRTSNDQIISNLPTH